MNEMKPWGIALERLREERVLSIGELCRGADMERSQYARLCKKFVEGPSIVTMQRLLDAMKCTWAEWGQVYDSVMVGAAPRDEVPLKKAVGHHGLRARSAPASGVKSRKTRPR